MSSTSNVTRHTAGNVLNAADLKASLDKAFNGLAERLGAKFAKLSAPQPLQFMGGVPLAKMSRGEVDALLPEYLALLGTYAKDAAQLRKAGLSLTAWFRTHWIDEHGVGFGAVQMPEDLQSALAKQEEQFAAVYGAVV